MRIPRPVGTTLLAIEYQKLGSDEAKENLIQHIVSHYALNGFRYQGHSISIPSLAQKLKIPESSITKAISNIGTSLGNIADPESLNETAKTLLTLSTSFSLSDRGLIQSQLETLLQSQGKSYRPFISSEVNKVLKLMLESNKNLIDLYKSFFNTNSSTVNILNVHSNKEDNKDYLSPTEALQLISSNQALPTTSDASVGGGSRLWDKYSIGDNPSVRERRSGTEALRALEPSPGDVYKPKSLEATEPKSSHEDHFSRRGYEVIDTDSLPTNE